MRLVLPGGQSFRIVQTRKNSLEKLADAVAAQAAPKIFEALCRAGVRVIKAPSAMRYRAVVDQDGRIVDYQDVFVKGYLVTWNTVDRDGEHFVRGSITDEAIRQFLKTPVMLLNHDRTVESVAGEFVTVRNDDKGLYVEAILSNSPAELMRHMRFSVVEKNLRALSIGGRFKRDGRAIVSSTISEGSLVSIPSNPEALLIS